MKRAWAFSCILALSATLSGCGKDGSPNATQEPGASASQAPVQLGQAASDTPAASGAQERSAPAAVTKAQLPGVAAETLRLIKAGGPFPFGEDTAAANRPLRWCRERQVRGFRRTYHGWPSSGRKFRKWQSTRASECPLDLGNGRCSRGRPNDAKGSMSLGR